MPSPSEPFGLTALEAIRSNLSVIASENCGFTGIVPSTPTFKYYDIQKFADIINYYLHYNEKLSELLKNQQRELENYSWSKEVSGFIKLCKELTKKN